MSKKVLCWAFILLFNFSYAYSNGDLVAAQTNYQNSVQELNDANDTMNQASQVLAAQNKQLANTQKNITMLKQQASAAEAKIKIQEQKVQEAKTKVNTIWSSIQQQ
jgi:hypothetical protein